MRAYVMLLSNEQVIAIVTGVGSSIGRATAVRLASDGFAVGIVGLNLEAAQQTAQAIGDQPLAVQVDVSDTAAVRHMVETVSERLGPSTCW